MKEFTNVAGSVTSFASSVNFFALAGYHAQGHDLNVFQKFPEIIFTPKEWFISKKGRKRVKEWREVTFMKEWVKPLYIGYHQALELSLIHI